MNRNHKEKLILSICKLSHEYGLTQEQIARVFKLSRVTVSKLLTKAYDTGLISLELNDPLRHRSYKLEKELQQIFSLKEILIIEDGTSQLLTSTLAKATARLLTKIIEPNSRIGLIAGKVLDLIPDYLLPRSFSELRFISIYSDPFIKENNTETKVIEKFIKKLGGHRLKKSVSYSHGDSYSTKNHNRVISFDRLDIILIDLDQTKLQKYFLESLRNERSDYYKYSSYQNSYNESCQNSSSIYLKNSDLIDLTTLMSAEWTVGVSRDLTSVPFIKEMLRESLINTLILPYSIAECLTVEFQAS